MNEGAKAVKAYVAALAAAAVAVTVLTDATAGSPAWGALPVLAALLVAGEYLFVRFRYGGEISTINLVEAVLAPMLFAFSAPVVVATVAATQVAGAVLRRNAVVKSAFNVAQWSLAAAVGAAVMATAGEPGAFTTERVAALIVALAVVGLVNHVAFAGVLAMINHRSPLAVARELGTVLVVGWFLGWAVNTLIGLLFALAYSTHAAAVVLFAVPLAVLHIAYRGYAGARSDRLRLTGLHRAARSLAGPLDPGHAIEGFLRDVAEAFEATAAALVFDERPERVIHRVDAGGYTVVTEPAESSSLEGVMCACAGAVRVTGNGHPWSEALVEAGWRDCLTAPLVEDGRTLGALVVYDQAGLEGFEAGELAVLEAVARETVATFAKGRLLATMLEERQKLAEIVGTTSDGILTIAADGRVRTWNPALERITGIAAADAVGKPALEGLEPVTVNGQPVGLDRWADDLVLPAELRITAADGEQRRLSCSYSRSEDETLVVVARDTTTVEEMAQLREEFGQLVAAEEAQREVVEQLRQAVVPPRPVLAGADLGVAFLAPDETAPTGGDLFDWHVLPTGELHLAVVDVLGHGVAATKDALSVVSTLRILSLQGCPLEDLVARADDLLAADQREIVATVVVARFDTRTGRLLLVSGGHPPALVVSGDGSVRQVAATGSAIGWPGAGSDGVAEESLQPSDTLVLYTDGLVEARKNIVEGIEVLMRHAALAAHLPAEELATQLLERAVSGAQRRDDTLALVMRATSVGEHRHEQVWRASPAAEEVGAVRRQVTEWMAARELDVDDIDDVRLVVSELLTNAVVAARSTVTVHVAVDSGRVHVWVSDDGGSAPDLSTAGHLPVPDNAQAGRGLFLVRSVMDDVTALTNEIGTTVRCVKRLRRVAVDEPPTDSFAAHGPA
ncbi:MAG TPA: SpoIIE family protein phosphatase [Acidimicrobiales bacterium]|nr:SpoIIE family protein phosphatase [Acidimicrobiales bacterium]